MVFTGNDEACNPSLVCNLISTDFIVHLMVSRNKFTIIINVDYSCFKHYCMFYLL